jgi:hypothetical protein
MFVSGFAPLARLDLTRKVRPAMPTTEVPADWRTRTTVDPVATSEILGLCRNSTYAAIAKGEIPSIRLGHRLLIPVAGLRRMLGELPALEAS